MNTKPTTEADQVYTCCGRDIFDIYGCIIGIRSLVASMERDSHDMKISRAIAAHMEYCMKFPSVLEASEIYSKVKFDSI